MATPPADLPPSAKLVFRVLEDDGPRSPSGLVAETGLARSTVDDATRRLRERGLAVAETPPEDRRCREYRLADNR